MAESRGLQPETLIVLHGKALKGRDCYRAIREQINQCRAMGVEPKRIWAGKDTHDAMQAMWDQVAERRDLRLPLGVAGVPMSFGSGLGRAAFVFEYHESGTVFMPEGDSSKRKESTVTVKPAVDDPLPFNS